MSLTPTLLRELVAAGEHLRWLCDAYQQTQKLRVATGNRIQAAARAADTPPAVPVLVSIEECLVRAEHDLADEMAVALRGHPAMPWLGHVRGVGPVLATKILALIGNIERYDTVAKLWRYSGYGVTVRPCAACRTTHASPRGCTRCHERGWTATRDRKERGRPLRYNERLKTALYQTAVSFVRSRSPYRAIYDAARERYEEREALRPVSERWSVAHCHQAALRRMIKVFLLHLYLVWREAEGLPLPPAVPGVTPPDPWRFAQRHP
ncbi:MAG: hypothetical protein PVF27_03860 [Gemmatimonadales bacterium]